MKRHIGFSTSIVLCVGLVFAQTGCQSGWKISNPFASHPRASSAETPEGLDALDDVDALTPPPENYTVGDASKSDRSESLAQRGKYEVEDKVSEVEKMESETREIAEKTDSYKSQESYQVADYSRSYQTDVPSGASGSSEQAQTYEQSNLAPQRSYAQAEPASQQSYVQTSPASQQSYAQASPASQQSYAQANQSPVQTTGQSFAPASSDFGFQSYSAPAADVATNARLGTVQNGAPYDSGNNIGSDFPTPSFQAAPSIANDGFPTVDSSFPVAQNTIAEPTSEYPNANYEPTPSSSQPVNVATNPESSVVTGATPAYSQPATYSTGATDDADPYSDVYYAPQTTSSGAGFAPGSADGLY